MPHNRLNLTNLVALFRSRSSLPPTRQMDYLSFPNFGRLRSGASLSLLPPRVYVPWLLRRRSGNDGGQQCRGIIRPLIDQYKADVRLSTNTCALSV
ncbi:hypothetical protein CI238_12733 [Colletotrichum incanum]|uniref:Uncharacterized protein n=1 Tax=Colletotrichum incanum TaxID=1573173 RepID=A0A166LH83_COLIC|nr:hypothetical protein CI238_12733 [Colletotrichum incanum]